MKPGDMVDVMWKNTSGQIVCRGVGLLLKKTHYADSDKLNMWDIAMTGEIINIPQQQLRLSYRETG